MRMRDYFWLTTSAVAAHRLRSFLAGLGIAIGIAAVILLTSIGEGIHKFVIAEFTQFGTSIIGVTPGRVSTHGASIGIFGTVRPLSVEDAEALRRAPYVEGANPMISGNAEVEFAGRSRRTTIYGVGPSMPQVLRLEVAVGSFLPAEEAESARAFAVLGSKLKQELFGAANPLGRRVRVGGNRYTIIGVMAEKGQVLGFDLDDTLYIPAASALELFNREGLMEIQVLYRPGAPLPEVLAGLRRVLIARHGREDFTLTPQQEQLKVMASVLSVLTFAVGALGGISLLVGGIGILTIMIISVSERTSEIGLLRALGAPFGQIMWLFLGEAILLSAAGGLAGLLLGAAIAEALQAFFPALPVSTPWYFAVLAEGVAVAVGLAAGVLPARRAAMLDPVETLRSE